MRLTACLLCLALVLPCAASTALAAPAGETPLVLNSADPAPRSRPGGTGINDRLVAEAFLRLDLPVRLVQLPPERAMQNADQGVDDGTYTRIAGLGRLYPNLVMVPEPLDEFQFTAFTRNPALRANGWDGLKAYHVGLITGWKIVEANTQGARGRTAVKDEQALFALLDSGRAEVVVVDRRVGLEAIRRGGYTGVRALDPPLERRQMFLYLHKRHAGLVPRLAEAIRQMRREGLFQRLAKSGPAEAPL